MVFLKTIEVFVDGGEIEELLFNTARVCLLVSKKDEGLFKDMLPRLS